MCSIVQDVLVCAQVVEPSSCTGDLSQLCSQVTVSGEMSKEDTVHFIKKAVEGLFIILVLINKW